MILNRYLILGAVMVSLMAYGWFEHNRFTRTKAEFGEFVAAQKALALKAEADKIIKEKENEKRINDALCSRDIAVARLRDFQSASRSELPGSPQTSGRTDTICFTTDRFDSGLLKLEGILTEGQIAVEERKAWLNSWPH